MERMDLNEARSRIRARSDLNAFISLSDEQGSGDVVAVKDLVDVAGMVTTAGGIILPKTPATHDAAVVRRCLDETSFEKLSGGRGPGEEDRSSLFRKGVLGDWQKHFDPATHDYLVQKCGVLMRHFGFL